MTALGRRWWLFHDDNGAPYFYNEVTKVKPTNAFLFASSGHRDTPRCSAVRALLCDCCSLCCWMALSCVRIVLKFLFICFLFLQYRARAQETQWERPIDLGNETPDDIIPPPPPEEESGSRSKRRHKGKEKERSERDKDASLSSSRSKMTTSRRPAPRQRSPRGDHRREGAPRAKSKSCECCALAPHLPSVYIELRAQNWSSL